jgi:hypothetical protein
LSEHEALLEQTKLTLSQVSNWVSMTGGHDNRLTFFNQVADDTGFVKKTIVPLLSMRTTGSIAVERVAKPLKNFVKSKTRNRNGLDKTEVYLRAGINLRFLYEANKVMKKTIKEYTKHRSTIH